MMEVTLSRSWHFWLANFGGKRISSFGTDICSYTRAVFKGLFWLTLAVSAAIFMVVGTGNMLYEFYQIWGTDGKLSLFGEVITFLWVFCFVGITFLTTLYVTIEHAVPAMIRSYRKIPRKTEPSFLSSVYRKFKDKTCFTIKFKE